MAKPKRSADDLDAELAALEAELAALGQKKPKREAKPPAPPEPAGSAGTEAAAPPASAKPRFGGLKLPALSAPKEAAPTPAAPAEEPAATSFDATLWRQEDGAWVRSVPREPVVIRRILDEEGRIVREEPATMRDLDDETPMKAERGIGKLFRRRGK